MRIGNDYSSISPSFSGFWNNKAVLKGLEAVSEHGTSFIAATTFVMASGVRPLAISATPNIKEENKKYAVSNSIASGAVKFGIGMAVALPIENAIKKAEKNPEKFLSKRTVKFFKKGTDSLSNSRNFKFATQFMKQSIGFITAIPKSVMTVALIPVLTKKLYSKKEKEQEQNIKPQMQIKSCNKLYTPSFKGGLTDIAAKGAGKILDNKTVQKMSEKFSTYDIDIARNMAVATDLLLTASFANQTIKNEEIEKERKKPLIMNTVYGTAASILGGCAIDEAVKKNTENFMEKFKTINKNDPKLAKYVEGINIIRPTMIFAGIYYGIFPVITTYLADKTDK